jgi:anaerobic magnesium-protoporphyrin IX monomethyl ester cyclase
MNICLIKPSILHKGASFALMPTPPLGLAYIAGALKQKLYHKLQVIDASAEGINTTTHFCDDIYIFGLTNKEIISKIIGDVDVFCLSFMFTNNWLYDRELVRDLKKRFPKSVIIAGGEHANAAPEFCFKQAPLDYIVFGEGEETIIELVEKIEKKEAVNDIKGIAYSEKGKILINKTRKRISNIEDIVWPAWELFPMEIYFENKMSHGVYRGRTLPVMATRGCPYECTFCSSPQMWGRQYEMRPPKDFVDELEYLNKTYQITNFDLFDLTAIIHKKWILEMCDELKNRGLNITYQLPSGTRAEAIDLEVATALFNSGCKNITYAPESGSERVLRAVKKKVKISSMLNSIKHSSEAGMNIHLNMIIGFPDDTHKDIVESLKFVLKSSWLGANDLAIAVFTPYPGSKLFDQLVEEKKIDLYDDKTLEEIISSYDLWPNKVYSYKISPTFIKMYVFLMLITFYSSNYIFRPVRLYRTMRNLILKKHESRLEQILYKNFFKNLFSTFSVSTYKKERLL